jgi:hypothetical protein
LLISSRAGDLDLEVYVILTVDSPAVYLARERGAQAVMQPHRVAIDPILAG